MPVHTIRKGLDLPLAGAPEQRQAAAPAVRQVALLGADTPGLRPALAVEPGDRVLRGQLLFEDRKTPGLRYTAPAAGTVRAVHRGPRRSFLSLVIDVADDDGHTRQVVLAQLPRAQQRPADPAALRALLLECGLWAAFRTRPFSRVPAPDSLPQAIFVTAIDSHPHAPDPQVVLAGRESDFQAGLLAMEQLAPAPVFLCRAAGSRIAAPASSRSEVHEFDGPHPAGNVGLHIHRLYPAGAGRVVWHIGYQEVTAIGHLLNTGQLEVDRVVSLAGPAVLRPRLFRARLGACLADLTQGELQDGELRVISGSVLDGRAMGGEVLGFLGRHHQQVSVLPEGRGRDLLGWIAPRRDKYSIWRVVAGHFAHQPGLPLTTTTNGGARAMVPIGAYERVMPMDIMATHLLRALITGDDEQAVALGALELDEEDLALCTFVCPGKTEYGPLLRQALDRLEKDLA